MATRQAIPEAGSPDPALDARAAARAAGLRYVRAGGPGIRRVRSGRGFRYVGADGAPVRDAETLARIRSLAIPPAWTDVWISPVARGHVQATGRDARGRKQYRYHPEWRRVRDETKFHRMIAFANALPAIRRRVSRDLRLSGLPQRKVVAVVVRLLDKTYARIGNAAYAKDNGSFGLTTLQDRHATVHGDRLRLEFNGKGGKRHVLDVGSPTLARIVKRCRDLPGYELFQYLDEDGEPRLLTSDDINGYLREVTGDDFTAKDFRTWAGTVLAATALGRMDPPRSARQATRNVNAAIESVAGELGNTPAICKKSYVHPQVIEAYVDGTLRPRTPAGRARGRDALRSDEAELLRLLRRLARRSSRTSA